MTHVIPKNVSSDGGVAGGLFKKRNAVEAAIYAVGCFLLFKMTLFFLPLLTFILVYLIVGILPGFVLLIGIGDQSAFEFFTTKLRYMRRRDIIPYVIQTETLEYEPDSLAGKYSKKFEKRKAEKERKEKERIEHLRFLAENPDVPKRKAKKARKKLKKEEKMQIRIEKNLNKKAEKKAKKEAEKKAAEKKKKKGKRKKR